MRSETSNEVSNELTEHAKARMAQRQISLTDVETVISYGRVVYTRGAWVYVLGRRDKMAEPTLRRELERLEGLQVVTSRNGAVLTVYRNLKLRLLRPRRRRGLIRRPMKRSRILIGDAAA